MTDQTCNDAVTTAIGTIACDLPAGHDDLHAGGDRTYWGVTSGNGPRVQICREGEVAEASRAYRLPVVSDDGYNHAPECYSCHGEATNDTCPRSIALRKYVTQSRTPKAVAS